MRTAARSVKLNGGYADCDEGSPTGLPFNRSDHSMTKSRFQRRLGARRVGGGSFEKQSNRNQRNQSRCRKIEARFRRRQVPACRASPTGPVRQHWRGQSSPVWHARGAGPGHRAKRSSFGSWMAVAQFSLAVPGRAPRRQSAGARASPPNLRLRILDLHAEVASLNTLSEPKLTFLNRFAPCTLRGAPAGNPVSPPRSS
jgi:hypothetical protein